MIAAMAENHRISLDRTDEAIRHYESALAVDSYHTESLIGLGTIENRRPGGSLVLAYGYLTTALQIDKTSHKAGYELGLVLKKQGQIGLASEHLLTALESERYAPFISFAVLPRRV